MSVGSSRRRQVLRSCGQWQAGGPWTHRYFVGSGARKKSQTDRQRGMLLGPKRVDLRCSPMPAHDGAGSGTKERDAVPQRTFIFPSCHVEHRNSPCICRIGVDQTMLSFVKHTKLQEPTSNRSFLIFGWFVHNFLALTSAVSEQRLVPIPLGATVLEHDK